MRLSAVARSDDLSGTWLPRVTNLWVMPSRKKSPKSYEIHDRLIPPGKYVGYTLKNNTELWISVVLLHSLCVWRESTIR